MDPLIIGRVASVLGLKGWVKIHSFTRPREQLFSYDHVLLGQGSKWGKRTIKDSQLRGSSLRVLFANCINRNQATDLIGLNIGVSRSNLSPTRANEFYWVDLIGLDVFNLDNKHLGEVVGLLETGANDVLEIMGDRTYLIPFVQKVYILDVNLIDKRILADWHADD